MRIKKTLTPEQIGKLLPILIEHMNYSLADIKSFDELTPEEKDMFNYNENCFYEFVKKDTYGSK